MMFNKPCIIHFKELRPSNTGNIFLSHNKCCVASCDRLLRVLPPPRTTNFYVAESKRCFYFLQHESLLRDKLHENVARITWPLLYSEMWEVETVT